VKATHLVDQEPLLHTQVGTNLLVDCPGEFAIQLPRHKGQKHGANTYDDGYGDEEGLDIGPVLGVEEGQFHQALRRIGNLVELDGSIYEDSQIHGAQADDLNRVLCGQSIIDENELVHKGKDKQTEVGGNGLGVRGGVLSIGKGGGALQRMPEFDEDIAVVVVSTDAMPLADDRPAGMSLTYLSRPSATPAWISDMAKKDHVHSEFGMYIIFLRGVATLGGAWPWRS
jgi:hypothetical protein